MDEMAVNFHWVVLLVVECRCLLALCRDFLGSRLGQFERDPQRQIETKETSAFFPEPSRLTEIAAPVN
jgi:hypothetical protein